MAKNIMTHLVAGYPSLEESRRIAESLIAAGAGALEIQFPYSDPMADGPAIQEACQISLDKGFRLQQGFDLVKDLSSRFDTPIYIMSYGGPVYSYGVETYVKQACQAGAEGLIIPDLCVGLDEGLYKAGAEQGIAVIPVMLSSVKEDRLQEILKTAPPWIYLVLRRGITGTYTVLEEEHLSILNRLEKQQIPVYVGFGIQKREQVEQLAPHSAGQIVGSRLVQAIQEATSAGSDPAAAVALLMKDLTST